MDADHPVRGAFFHADPQARLDEKGASIGWNISKRTFRAMIDSALGLDPDDNSEEAKAKRRLRGLADLDGITFVAKIAVEPSTDPRYPDKNKLDRPVLPNEKEWGAVMNGENVAPSPSRPRSAGSGGSSTATAPKPAWAQQQAKPAQHAAAAAWQRPATPPLGQDAGNGQPAGSSGVGAVRRRVRPLARAISQSRSLVQPRRAGGLRGASIAGAVAATCRARS